ncbi:MAG: hypothetical protein ACRCT6_01705 [Notoacmeibacter sp.]
MHRFIAISILLFWAVVFGGLAHVSLVGLLQLDSSNAADLDFLLSASGGNQLVPVMMMLVSALFGWSILALVATDHASFREVEEYAYATGIIVMTACSLLGLIELGLLSTVPVILTAALAASIAASKSLIAGEIVDDVDDQSKSAARYMALGAAHNSLLSRVSGRGLQRPAPLNAKIPQFPPISRNPSQFPGGKI